MGTVPWASSPLLPLWEVGFSGCAAHAAEEEESGATAAR